MPDGSTAICCLVQRAKAHGARRLLVANLGDSRAAVVRADGVGMALSTDHKPNRPDEKARGAGRGGRGCTGCGRLGCERRVG